MIYDSRHRSYGDGVWHCPFPPEWVERMKRAAKRCRFISAEQVDGALKRIENGECYVLPPGDFLSEEQDARGLPLSYCMEEERRYSGHPTCCTAIYDYDSIPDVVITDGENDWPLVLHERVLTA